MANTTYQMVSIWSMMNQSFISYTFITYFRGNCISHHKRWEKQRDNKAPTGHVSLDLWNLWFNDHSGYHGLWSRTDCWKKETRNENKLKSKRLLQMLMYHLKMLSMKSKPLKSCRKKLETALESQKYVLSLGISIFILEVESNRIERISNWFLSNFWIIFHLRINRIINFRIESNEFRTNPSSEKFDSTL